ncbi:DUF5706 domain-containing protein [Flammeovirgaceae bacterium SG7u.111]|nr:DUF5706 domain-containing protein [Flammeovirgaceae bacterium SG7u.132]WPO36407.1 DUF5706 domain-containing protein [Flammeovirgaceae bacterium SG7u.111]
MEHSQQTTQSEKSVLESVADYAGNLLKEEIPSHLEYHDFNHTQDVIDAADEIGKENNLSEEEMEILLIAAWFHDTGHKDKIDEHEEASKNIAENYLREIDYPQEKIDQVKSAIDATKMPQKPKNKLEQVICDADLAHLGGKGFLKKTTSLMRERSSLGTLKHSEEDWYANTVEFARKHKYFTQYGKTVLEAKKQKNLKKLNKKIDKINNQKDDILSDELDIDLGELKKLKKKLQKVEGRPERGIETMFRVTSRNHVDLSAMADTKANIMISVNSILITIVIGVLMRKLDSNPHLIIPTVILMIVCLAAIVFAIFATRPSITTGKFTKEDIKKKQANLLFFGNFHKMELKDFEWGMNELINDSEYLYGSMIRDIYFLGSVLGKKYKYLRTSYTIFMYGLIIASIVFLIATILYGSGEPDIEDTFW